MLAVATIALAARYLPITNRVVLGVAALSPYLMLGAPLSLIVFALQSNWFLTAAAASVTIAAVAVQCRGRCAARRNRESEFE